MRLRNAARRAPAAAKRRLLRRRSSTVHGAVDGAAAAGVGLAVDVTAGPVRPQHVHRLASERADGDADASFHVVDEEERAEASVVDVTLDEVRKSADQLPRRKHARTEEDTSDSDTSTCAAAGKRPRQCKRHHAEDDCGEYGVRDRSRNATSTNSSDGDNANLMQWSTDQSDSASLHLLPLYLLQAAFSSEDRIEDANWLTSTFIDLVLWRLAAQYPRVHFLATDFCSLHLPSIARQSANSARYGATGSVASRQRSSSEFRIRDILGRAVEIEDAAPIVFVANVGRIHWNLFRVQFYPHAELQLFEPMGRPSSRTGISYRSVPRCVLEWLDVCYPQHKSWRTRAVSAITRPQQVSGFDCGVACLLYADKCGQGQLREQIDDSTDQDAITTFRGELQRQLRHVLAHNKPETERTPIETRA